MGKIKRCYQEFIIVGMDQQLLSEREQVSLDKNIFQPPQVLEVYPQQQKDKERSQQMVDDGSVSMNNTDEGVASSSIDGILEFVAPHGVRLRYLPRIAAEKLCTNQYDRGHILQFSDSSGVPKFAYCLTINEYYEIPFAQSHIRKELKDIHHVYHAARRIQRFFRNYKEYMIALNQVKLMKQQQLGSKQEKTKKCVHSFNLHSSGTSE